MDKITRMLMLYSSLMNGEEINKTIFCFENDCSPRSFDRDIKDIRLFLSESFSVLGLNYNRKNNTYYIKGGEKTTVGSDGIFVYRKDFARCSCTEK